MLGLGAGAVIVGAWATGGEMPLQSLRAGSAAPGRTGEGGGAGGGVGTLEEAAAAGVSGVDLDGATLATAGGEGQAGEALLEDSAAPLQLESPEGAQPSLAAEPVERAARREEGSGEDPSPQPEQGEAPLVDDSRAPRDDPRQSGAEPAEAPAEAPAGDATVITEEDMKAISDLLAAAVGVGAPLAASAADTADAGAAVGGDRGAGEPSGDPAPVLAPRVVDPEGGEVPGPEEAAPAEAALSSGVGDSELPSTTSGRASAGADAVAARTGTRPPAGALPRRAVEAVLELASPADLVGRALKEGETATEMGEQWELYGAMHRQAAADAEFVTEALNLVQGAYEVS